METKRPRIVVADDEPVVLMGFADLAEKCGGEVVGMAGDGEEAIDLIRSLRPDLMILDIDMGMADRMLFSHDFISVSTFWDHQPTPEGQAYVDGMCPERFGFLQQVVFPRLVELGADGDQLERMLEENPRRFFEGC